MLTGIHLSGLCLLSRERLGVALAATGRLGWQAGHLISPSPELDRPAPGRRFGNILALLRAFFSYVLIENKPTSCSLLFVRLCGNSLASVLRTTMDFMRQERNIA